MSDKIVVSGILGREAEMAISAIFSLVLATVSNINGVHFRSHFHFFLPASLTVANKLV